MLDWRLLPKPVPVILHGPLRAHVIDGVVEISPQVFQAMMTEPLSIGIPLITVPRRVDIPQKGVAMTEGIDLKINMIIERIIEVPDMCPHGDRNPSISAAAPLISNVVVTGVAI